MANLRVSAPPYLKLAAMVSRSRAARDLRLRAQGWCGVRGTLSAFARWHVADVVVHIGVTPGQTRPPTAFTPNAHT